MTSALMRSVTELIEPWAANRDQQVAQGASTILVPHDVRATWSTGKMTRIVRIARTGGCSEEVLRYVLSQTRKDRDLDFVGDYDTGLFARCPEVLVGVLPHAEVHETYREQILEATLGGGGGQSARVVHSLERYDWFHWPAYASTDTATCHPTGRRALDQYRGQATDPEAWDALVWQWTGSISSLLEACMLVNR